MANHMKELGFLHFDLEIWNKILIIWDMRNVLYVHHLFFKNDLFSKLQYLVYHFNNSKFNYLILPI